MKYYKSLENGYIFAVSINYGSIEIDKTEYNAIIHKIQTRPHDKAGYTYKLCANTLEWELVKMPPIDPDPMTEEEALTRYANNITGANDTNIIGVAETLINEKIKEG